MANSIVTVRPNGTSGAIGTPVGAASFAAALADDVDTSYITVDLPINTGYGIPIDFATPVLPANTQIRQVRLRWRDSTTGALTHDATLFDLTPQGVQNYYYTARSRFTGPAAAGNRELDAVPLNYQAASWPDLQAQLFISEASSTQTYRVYSAAIDVEHNQAPVVSAVTPTGSITVDTPTIGWTYTDPEGDLQERFRVKVFSQAQYTAAGFDAATSVAVWDSGVVVSANKSVAVGVPLENTIYRAFPIAGDVGSGGRMSAFGPYAQFTVATVPPNAPTLTAAITAQGNASLTTAYVSGGAGPAALGYFVEKSEDNGVTWTNISGDLTSLNYVDRYLVWDQDVRYRVRAWALSSGSQRLTSAPSNVVTLHADAAVYGWQLYSPATGVQRKLQVIGSDLVLNSDRDEAVMQPLGAEFPVVFTGPAKAEQFSVELFFDTKADKDSFELDRLSVGPKFLRMREGALWITFIGSRALTVPSTAKHRIIALGVQQVAAP